jgi:hypothetical protein
LIPSDKHPLATDVRGRRDMLAWGRLA